MRTEYNQVQGRTAFIKHLNIMPDQNSEMDRTQELVFALQNPDCYYHPVISLSILETHISWIVLTGTYAYKIKKPVNFGFVDFSSLEKRKYFCDEELRLNRRFSTDLYLQTIAIRGSHSAPLLHGNGEVIEYAVKMQEFPQHCLMSHLADNSQLLSCHVDSMADTIADIHSRVPRAKADSHFGSATSIAKWSDENFLQIENSVPVDALPEFFADLKSWCQQTFNSHKAGFDGRQSNGFIRECHGDLHLGNMVFLGNRCIAFDCIEFNDELRWIDTISEVAFVVMDLQARDQDEFSWRFLNHYLAINGDYSGLAILPYYIVYRALVRAKVAALQDNGKSCTDNRPSIFSSYLQLAQKWTKHRQPLLIIMHGLSGSGKSTVAENLAGRLGAIQIRSDLERKRLFGLDADESSESSIDSGIYTPDASERTYRRLEQMAEEVLLSGFHVIVDAACLKSSQRNLFYRLASKLGLACFLISCEAEKEELQRRIMRRLTLSRDASEANLEVLEQQLKHQHPVTGDELPDSNRIICRQRHLGDSQLKSIQSG